jgi:hypothetical protein
LGITPQLAPKWGMLWSERYDVPMADVFAIQDETAEPVVGEAVSPLQHALTLNPNVSQNFVWLNLLAVPQLFGGWAKEAIHSRRRMSPSPS